VTVQGVYRDMVCRQRGYEARLTWRIKVQGEFALQPAGTCLMSKKKRTNKEAKKSTHPIDGREWCFLHRDRDRAGVDVLLFDHV
jgi:hypothetical protein